MDCTEQALVVAAGAVVFIATSATLAVQSASGLGTDPATVSVLIAVGVVLVQELLKLAACLVGFELSGAEAVRQEADNLQAELDMLGQYAAA